VTTVQIVVIVLTCNCVIKETMENDGMAMFSTSFSSMEHMKVFAINGPSSDLVATPHLSKMEMTNKSTAIFI
jgi:hypothetical protein